MATNYFKKISFYLLGGLYIMAGINHFWHPDFYLPLIPDYLPFHESINRAGGIVELLLGILVFISTTRRLACYGIIVLLIFFIPSHIYFIQIGGCVSKDSCAPVWFGWIRLLLIHPLLIYWAYSCRKS